MKIPTVVALSRKEVEHSKIKLPNIIISIRSPGQRTAIVGDNNPLDVLFLEFNDIDSNGQIWTLHGFQSRDNVKDFTPEMAKEALDFVNRYKDQVDIIVCQCEAGISRSSGMASSLCTILGNPDADKEFWFGNNRYRPNANVYKLMLEAANMTLKQQYEKETENETDMD